MVNLNGERFKRNGCAHLGRWYILTDSYYHSDLAWVHHTGHAHHVEKVGTGIVRLLRDAGLGSGARILDAGWGSGLLARTLRTEGFAVLGVDASAAMIELARRYEPGAQFEVVRLPTRKPPGMDGAVPTCDAVVSTGHVLNYLDTRTDVAQALGELARAVQPGGLLAIGLMTERYCDRLDLGQVHAKVQDDWAITRFSRPEPHRFDRAITVFRREGPAFGGAAMSTTVT
jgi:SAM-dependent methyltransferase